MGKQSIGILTGGADVVLIPKLPYEIDEIIRVARERSRFGKRFSIVVVAEGDRPPGGGQVVAEVVAGSSERVRLGGIGHQIARQVEEATAIACRVTQLGHLQRGGTPTPLDRVLATQFAVKAVDLVAERRLQPNGGAEGG